MIKSGATTGRVSIVETLEPIFTIWSPLAVFRCNKQRMIPRFMFFSLQADGFQKQVELGWTYGTQQNIGMRTLEQLKICLPPVQEQLAISAYLDRQCAHINNIIEKTKSSIEEYKKLRQAVITQAVTKGVRGDRAMKNTGYEWITEVPKEWELIPSKYLFGNSDVRKMPDDVQLTASQKHGIISQQEYMELENAKIVFANQGIENWKHVEPNDFIISLRSFQGGLELSEVTGCITWHYIVMKALKPVNYRFYKWLFKSKIYITALQRTCNYIRDGQDLRYSNFIQVPLFEPSLEEQEEIAIYLDKKTKEIDTLITKKESFLTELESYKKSMIYEYVTGKKEVPSA